MAVNARSNPDSVVASRELTLTRLFDAPRDLVWKAWTEPEHLERWQGAPQGFTVTEHTVDMRPGGEYRLCMRSPEGRDHWLQGVYREVVVPARLVFTHVWLDASGSPGQETLVTITFTERGGRTELNLHQTGFTAIESRDGHEQGWTSTFDRFAGYLPTMTKPRSALALTLPSDREILMSRVFEAPRHKVFEAYSKPEHLRQWWGRRGSTLPVCDMDFRPGGAYRFVQRDPQGREYGFRGVYREIVAPERLVYTFEFEGMPGHVALETVTFVEHAGKTTVTNRMLFDSMQDRDGMLKSGMEEGAAETLDRLAELLILMNA